MVLTFLLISSSIAISCTERLPISKDDNPPELLHLWSGAPHTDGITLGVQWSQQTEFEFRISSDSLFGNGVTRIGKLLVNKAPYYHKQKVEGLTPDRTYYYGVFIEDKQMGRMGSFRTFAEGPQSFHITLGSCQRTGSEAGIFRAMAAQEPLFFLQTGDYHYENIASDCDSNFLAAYQANWYSEAQNALLRKTPFVYMWDDHDYGPNNSDATAPCRENAVSAYRSYIPHYTQAFEESTGPISQSFVVGRVRFVLSDLRSQKVKPTYDQCTRLRQGSNFGEGAHLDWFFEELLAAKNAGQVVAWVSGVPYINHEGGPNYKCKEKDNWGGYPEERQRIANFVKEHGIAIFILSGDAHMAAIDDGSNSGYAEGGGGSIPVFQAGPLHDSPSYKGGPYSHGHSAAPYQYGLMQVEDNGNDEVCVEWKAYNEYNQLVLASATGRELSYRFCLAP